MGVIEHDFGLDRRRTERRFTKLLELDALHEINISANPLPYLERASERIFQLQQVIFDAAQALKTPTPESTSGEETIQLDKAEYLRLKKCQEILEQGFAKFGTSDEAF
jgi:hypothetical protein